MKFDRLKEIVEDPWGTLGEMKERGKKVVGYACSYVPEELIIAAGAHPARLTGTREGIRLADGHLQSYCCSLVRGILEDGLSGRGAVLDGVVFPHTCDSIQRLSDIWRLNVKGGFHLDLVLPVKLDTDSARDYLVDVLKRFLSDLERALGVEVSEADLRASCLLTNEIRRLLHELYMIRWRRPELLAGADLHLLNRAVGIADRNLIVETLREVVADLGADGARETTKGNKNILLAGGMCSTPDIFNLIAEAGGRVVWDDFCNGGRMFLEPLRLDGDPIAAVADRFLSRVVCPCKHRGLTDRANHLKALATERGAGGVVFVHLKYCDPHAFDFPYLKAELEKAGIASLLLEVEDPLPPGAQIRTRLEAFLEMLD